MKRFIFLFVSISLLTDPVFADSKRDAFMKTCTLDDDTTSKSMQRKFCKCSYEQLQLGLDVLSSAVLCYQKYPN